MVINVAASPDALELPFDPFPPAYSPAFSPGGAVRAGGAMRPMSAPSPTRTPSGRRLRLASMEMEWDRELEAVPEAATEVPVAELEHVDVLPKAEPAPNPHLQPTPQANLPFTPIAVEPVL
jgi:hypothetical protein